MNADGYPVLLYQDNVIFKKNIYNVLKTLTSNDKKLEKLDIFTNQ